MFDHLVPRTFMTRVTLSVRSAARLSAAFFILAHAGCSSDKAFEPVVEPFEPAVATSLAAMRSATQPGSAGFPVQVPMVIVKDQRGVGMRGVAVTFAVASGGGSVTGESATTNTAGIATVGSWTLGATPGLNTLTASVTGLPSITLAATGTVKPPAPCVTVVMTHAIGTTTNGTLGLEDCPSEDGVFIDFYATNLSGVTAYLFRQSATFDTYLSLRTSVGILSLNLIAENDDESSATTNSAIKALLPAGSYALEARSAIWGDTGAYSLSSATTSPDVSGCEEVYIALSVSTTQTIQTTDCLRTNGPVYADQFLIYLEAGQSLTLSMASTAVDSFLELYFVDPTTRVRRLVASNDNVDTSGSKDARVAYTAPAAGYYAIFASTALNGQTGGYTLGIQ